MYVGDGRISYQFALGEHPFILSTKDHLRFIVVTMISSSLFRFFAATSLILSLALSAGLQQVKNFGTNPTNLDMFL